MAKRGKPIKRFRVRVTGHETLPDLDFETDDLNADQTWRQYPVHFINIQVPILSSQLFAEQYPEK